jgi:hypothetical protein
MGAIGAIASKTFGKKSWKVPPYFKVWTTKFFWHCKDVPIARHLALP